MNTQPEPRKAQILLVEDSATDRMLAMEALRDSRISNTVHCVTDGEEAMQFLRNEGRFAKAPTPDLILLDLDLPKKNGREVLVEIKADEILRYIPVVVLSTSKAEEDIAGAYGVHANCYITKPLDFDQFSRVVTSLEDFWFEIVTLPSSLRPEPTFVSQVEETVEDVIPKRQQTNESVTMYRTLLLENSASDRLLIKSALSESRMSAFEITEIDRVETAEQELERTRFDVIISDLGLPDSEGLETVRRLMKSAAGTPIVVLTMMDNEENGTRAVQEGAADYVVKGRMDGRLLARTIRFAVERSRIEEQMRHAQRMESLGVLAGGIAHDFNNLLMVVRGNAELQRRLELDNPQIDWTSSQILAAADRASTLTRQLLAFGRRERIHLSTIDLNETVSEFIKMIERLLGPTIKLQMDLTDEELSISADASLLEQVIMNLSVNARDAMPDGGVLRIETLVVDIKADRARGVPPGGAGAYAQLKVSDQGSGMSPDLLGRIFEPFFTTKTMEKGTGLGLSTSFGIARQHRGTIEVDSELGKGSEFTVLIPLSSESTQEADFTDTSMPTGNGETILVVDDEHMVRELTVSFLEMHGYRVQQADSGADVIRRWEELEPQVDLVLTDLIMPEGVSGRDLGTWLYEHKPELKVIYCSGFSRPHLNRKFRLREGVNFLSKPYSVGQLLTLVYNVLNSRL